MTRTLGWIVAAEGIPNKALPSYPALIDLLTADQQSLLPDMGVWNTQEAATAAWKALPVQYQKLFKVCPVLIETLSSNFE